jgi:chromosome segregation ATPase
VKALERRVQEAKDALKHVKEQQAAIKADLERLCEVQQTKLEGVKGKREAALSLIQNIRHLQSQLDQINAALPQDSSMMMGGGECWSVEELKGRLEAATVARDKRMAALSVQQQAVSDLHRLMHHQSDQLTRLRQQAADRTAQLAAVQAKQGGAGAAVEELCRWYRGMHELCEGMTGVHCDVVRPNYLHVTVTNPSTAQSVPIHLHVDRRTGKLQSATVP